MKLVQGSPERTRLLNLDRFRALGNLRCGRQYIRLSPLKAIRWLITVSCWTEASSRGAVTLILFKAEQSHPVGICQPELIYGLISSLDVRGHIRVCITCSCTMMLTQEGCRASSRRTTVILTLGLKRISHN